MFQIRGMWQEVSGSGQVVTTRRAEFGSVPEQLAFLRKMIDTYRGTTWARELALELTKDCEHRNKACYALAIAKAVQARIRYVNEYPEVFQSPRRTWELRAGDCDDFTSLTGSLIESLGIPTEVVGMKMPGPGGRGKPAWRHVFIRALIDGPGGRRLPMPLDGTLRNTPVETLTNPITRAIARGLTVETIVF